MNLQDNRLVIHRMMRMCRFKKYLLPICKLFNYNSLNLGSFFILYLYFFVNNFNNTTFRSPMNNTQNVK